MVHVLLVGTWPSRSCVIDSAMSNMAESLCLCRDPACVPAPGAPLHPVESEVIWGLRSGLPQEESLTPQALRSRWGCRWNGLGPLQSGVHHPFPSVLPLTTRCRSLHRRVSSLSGDDDSAALPPSGVVALSEPDPEMTAMLSRAAENVGLVWNPPPRPDPSRLDEWFLGGGRAGSQRPPPVPFFPEVHEELTRSWKAPFTARNKSCGSSALTTLDGGAALGYTGIPSVERSVAMQLCPTAATTLRGDPCLPSRACKYSSGLTGSACRACGEAASALHAMALLQVHQAKALKDLHEGGHDLTVLHELRAATDFALRATKVTAQSLGRSMSMLVVQERHLWLCLADMKEQEKVQFLNAPVSQTGLFGDAVESFAQQFSAAQKQTEAIKHIMHRRKPAASTPAAAPQPAHRRGRPSAAAPAPAQPQQPSTRQRRGAGRRQDAQPVQAPAKPGGKRRCKRPGDGGDCATPSPGGGPGGESFVSFCFCSAAGPAASGTQNINKRAVSSISGSQEEESGEPCITGSLPSSSLARRQVVAQEHPSCPFVEPGKGGSTPVPASSRHTPGCHKPQAGFLCFLPHEEESGECYTTHPDPAPCHHRPGRHRPRGGSLCSTMLPLRGYVCGPIGSAGTVSRSLVSTPRSVSVAPADHQTRLRDSVRPASPQVQGCPLHFSESCRCPCPVCGNRSPAGEGCDRTGPSSLHCAQEKRWVTTDLGSASFEPRTSQAAVQNVDAETHFRVRPSPRLVPDTGTWCSGTSASWAFGSTGKRANSCQRRGSLFSAWSWIRSTRQHASPRIVLSRCWTASRLYQAGRQSHWNSFRGSWGIWLQLRR